MARQIDAPGADRRRRRTVRKGAEERSQPTTHEFDGVEVKRAGDDVELINGGLNPTSTSRTCEVIDLILDRGGSSSKARRSALQVNVLNETPCLTGHGQAVLR